MGRNDNRLFLNTIVQFVILIGYSLLACMFMGLYWVKTPALIVGILVVCALFLMLDIYMRVKHLTFTKEDYSSYPKLNILRLVGIVAKTIFFAVLFYGVFSGQPLSPLVYL